VVLFGHVFVLLVWAVSVGQLHPGLLELLGVGERRDTPTDTHHHLVGVVNEPETLLESQQEHVCIDIIF